MNFLKSSRKSTNFEELIVILCWLEKLQPSDEIPDINEANLSKNNTIHLYSPSL